MRGIDGVNDGQQIFSYDQSFQDSKADDIKGLFTYQIPALSPGMIMNEEIALTMPAAFNFKQLRNGNVAITLNTYLGRDYMGSAGRFGNHLSHSIICDFSDFDVYPCELYGSTSLRSRMEYEEVNNPNPPEYLPVPELEKGYVIDPDTVTEFLGIGDNLEYFKQMIVAMLRFPREKKRVIICDETENIIKWIAALEYALPLDIAKKVNFTSYEYDPELSAAQICGVVSEGTHYNTSNYITSGRHYVFDFINNQFSNVELEEDPFIFFLDTAFSFSYDSLTEFHDFVLNNTTYRNSDEDYYAAFYLYNLLTEGISEIAEEEFSRIAEFVEKYTTEEIKKEVIVKLIEESYQINTLNNTYALTILGYMLKNMQILNVSQQSNIKQMIVDRLIQSLSDADISESAFVPLYDNIDSMARQISLSIPAELMQDNNRTALLNVLEQNVELWKVIFVVRILSDYVKDSRLSADELYPNTPIGAIYFGIVKMVYASGRQNGFTIVEKILDNFKTTSNYYVNMALNIEGYFADLQLTSQDTQHLWDYFSDYVIKTDDAFRKNINTELLLYDRCDEAYSIFSKRLLAQSNLVDVRNVFRTEFNEVITKNENYKNKYAAVAVRDYEKLFESKIGTVSSEDGFKMARELSHVAMQMQITDDYIIPIFLAVCEYIPLEKPTPENLKIIRDIFDYYKDILRKPIEGRLLLLSIGINFGKVTRKSDIGNIIDKLLLVADPNGADMKSLSADDVKSYFEWSMGEVLSQSLSADDFTQIYQLFSMGKVAHNIFMEYCCKVTYKKSKGEKDFEDFAEFLSFMFTNGTSDDQEMVGKYLCKLSKQKLEDLDEEMKTYFKRDRKATHAWENVREVAANTNPLLNNLSGLFKRK